MKDFISIIIIGAFFFTCFSFIFLWFSFIFRHIYIKITGLSTIFYRDATNANVFFYYNAKYNSYIPSSPKKLFIFTCKWCLNEVEEDSIFRKKQKNVFFMINIFNLVFFVICLFSMFFLFISVFFLFIPFV